MLFWEYHTRANTKRNTHQTSFIFSQSQQNDDISDVVNRLKSILEINRFNPPIAIKIDLYRKSIEIEVTEKIIYRILWINKIDNNR